MELRHLRAFRAIMHSGSTVGAAEALGVSQPSVSRLLGELEAQMGEPLFTRANGRLLPRASAESLLPEVERALAGIDGLVTLGSRQSAPLRIAAPAGVVTSIFSQAVRRLAAEVVNLRITAEIMSYHDVVDAVAMGRIDVGLVKAPVEHPAVTVQHLVTVGTDVVMHATHRLGAKKEVLPSDLRDEPLILLGRHRPFRVQLEQEFDTAGLVPNIVVETQAVSAACSFVAQGLGITVANSLLARSEAKDSLIFRPFRAAIQHSFCLVYEKRPVEKALVEAFVRHVRDVVGMTVGSDARP